jgi:hypothetical protein
MLASLEKMPATLARRFTFLIESFQRVSGVDFRAVGGRELQMGQDIDLGSVHPLGGFREAEPRWVGDMPPGDLGGFGLGLAKGPPRPRTATRDAIQQYGRTRWKQRSGYHRRSLAETAMFRLKRLFGGYLENLRFDPQTTEAYARFAALNIMTRLSMPETVSVR